MGSRCNVSLYRWHAAQAATNHAAHDHSHEMGAAAVTLQLNAGQKWATDAPLRLAMGNIRQAMAGLLHAIHEKPPVTARLCRAGEKGGERGR